MDENKSDMYNRLSSLFEENNLNIPDVYMSPRWRDVMERKRYFVGGDTTQEDSDTTILGMNVRYSNFIEDDKVYVVSVPRNFGYGKMPKVAPELYRRVEIELQNIIARAMSVPASLFEDEWKREITYNWHRFPDETILQWGDRLFSKELLDNPEIRWEYQKAVLGVPFNKLKAVFLKIVDSSRE